LNSVSTEQHHKRTNCDDTGHAWVVSKPQVESSGGIVASQNKEAARVGASILAAGGNAMDAAVATALALSVVEPWLSGLGGGGYLLHASATGDVETLDFNLRAPLNADISDYPLVGGEDGDWFNWPAVEEDRNLIGPMSVCVPGAVAGLASALQRHGTLSWEAALAPAITLAQRGMRIDWFAQLVLTIDTPGLTRHASAANLFLNPARHVTDPDDPNMQFLPMPGKAAMLHRLAEHGSQDFYEGQIADVMLKYLQEAGSKISAYDLAQYEPVWQKSLQTPYRDRQIHTIPGLSGGPSLLTAFNDLATEDLSASTASHNALVYARAIRRAYESRLREMGHAAAAGDCTSHLSVIDAQGNMVSLTNTLLSRFGSKVVVPDLDLLLNNGMMWFDPRPQQPNSIRGGAKPLANMSPVITTYNGKPDIAIGAAGGRQIFPAVLQLLSAIIDRKSSPEQAVHEPRIDASTPTILVNRLATTDTATAISAEYPVQITEDLLYPVQFAIPSIVQAGRDGAPNVGAVHPNSPWAAAVAAP
jgi:gamma-glutamyltranspeptidase/glutathione hydrolase